MTLAGCPIAAMRKKGGLMQRDVKVWLTAYHALRVARLNRGLEVSK